MQTALRILLIPMALADMWLGFGFLLDPAGRAASFDIDVTGPAGSAMVRADMPAFFLVSGGLVLMAAVRRRADWLVAPLGLFLVALTGRLLDLLLEGAYAGWWQPMAYEIAHLVLITGAIASWPWRGKPVPVARDQNIPA